MSKLTNWTHNNQLTIERAIIDAVARETTPGNLVTPIEPKLGDVGVIIKFTGEFDRFGILISMGTGRYNTEFQLISVRGEYDRWRNADWRSLARPTKPILDLLKEHGVLLKYD